MKYTKTMLAAALAVTCSMPVLADDHESEDSYMINILVLELKHGHGWKFGESMMAYKNCYAENDGEDSWSVWSAVDGAPNTMYIVSRMAMWSEMDETDAANRTCWQEHGEGLTSHVASANGRYWRHMADWSGDAEGYSVVTLHNFRVAEGEDFEAVVGEVTGHMKEAEAEHMGTWYQAVGQQRWGADYFVVSHYENFAAMDEDRPGANSYLVDAVGEEAAEAVWDRFGESLADMEPYWTQMLRRVDSMSYDADD